MLSQSELEPEFQDVSSRPGSIRELRFRAVKSSAFQLCWEFVEFSLLALVLGLMEASLPWVVVLSLGFPTASSSFWTTLYNNSDISHDMPWTLLG